MDCNVLEMSGKVPCSAKCSEPGNTVLVVVVVVVVVVVLVVVVVVVVVVLVAVVAVVVVVIVVVVVGVVVVVEVVVAVVVGTCGWDLWSGLVTGMCGSGRGAGGGQRASGLHEQQQRHSCSVDFVGVLMHALCVVSDPPSMNLQMLS